MEKGADGLQTTAAHPPRYTFFLASHSHGSNWVGGTLPSETSSAAACKLRLHLRRLVNGARVGVAQRDSSTAGEEGMSRQLEKPCRGRVPR
jgi:hypothetical protein